MNTHPVRRAHALTLVLLVSLLLASCSTSSGKGSEQPSGKDTTTVAKGASPSSKPSTDEDDDAGATDPMPDPDIELADDVVVVQRTKGKTVKRLGNDGASVLLDGQNPGVKKLEVGSVMLLTGVGAGRVEQLDDIDGDVAVTYSPVGLTDVIADGELNWDDTPIDMTAGVVNVSPDMAEVSGSPVEKIAYGLRSDAVKVKAGDFSASFDWKPANGGGGALQVVLTPSSKFAGKVTMDVDMEPITIGGGTKVTAGKVDFFDVDFANMKGSAKITTELQSLEQTAALHIPPFFKVPVSVSVPVPVAGIPFSLTFGATLQIDLSFSNPNGTLKGEAAFDFGGPAKFTYRGSNVTVGGDRTAKAEDTLKSLTGGGGTVGINITGELPKISFGFKILQTGAGVFISNGMVNSLTILPAPVLCHRVQVASVVAGGIDASFLGASVTFTRKAILDKRWTFFYPKNDPRCDGE